MAMLYARGVSAQDTVRINIRQAEKQFLEKNLLLLAESCNIDAAKANLLQAKLFSNPTFSASTNIHNLENYRWLDVSKGTGQYTFAVEQLIRLGGKRSKEAALAKYSLQISENQLYDILRTLRFSLGSIFYELHYTYRSLSSFSAQISLLEDLQTTYKGLRGKGIVSLGEQARIQALLYGLQSDKLDLQSTFNELQSQLQLLLQDNHTVFIPDVEDGDFAFRNPNNFSPTELVSQAVENRVDLQIAQEELAYQQKKVSLEKASAIPDLTLGVSYDRRGGFVKNLFGLNMSMPLPLFDRNKGNIRAAKAMAAQKELLAGKKQLEVENEVLKAYANALEADRISRSIDTDFEHNLQLLLQSITDNFRKKNVSMLEFTDFYESYKDNTVKINQIKNKKAQTMEELRFAVGNDF
jgi:cobalt-zinc-cadmium efflux system outer membrane protein